jgi:hypothetical protein
MRKKCFAHEISAHIPIILSWHIVSDDEELRQFQFHEKHLSHWNKFVVPQLSIPKSFYEQSLLRSLLFFRLQLFFSVGFKRSSGERIEEGKKPNQLDNASQQQVFQLHDPIQSE